MCSNAFKTGLGFRFTVLQSHKAHGPDGIPAYLLKETATSMAPLLTLIFKASHHQHQFPTQWRIQGGAMGAIAPPPPC